VNCPKFIESVAGLTVIVDVEGVLELPPPPHAVMPQNKTSESKPQKQENADCRMND
jgi:hypothetical protein